METALLLLVEDFDEILDVELLVDIPDEVEDFVVVVIVGAAAVVVGVAVELVELVTEDDDFFGAIGGFLDESDEAEVEELEDCRRSGRSGGVLCSVELC